MNYQDHAKSGMWGHRRTHTHTLSTPAQHVAGVGEVAATLLAHLPGPVHSTTKLNNCFPLSHGSFCIPHHLPRLWMPAPHPPASKENSSYCSSICPSPLPASSSLFCPPAPSYVWRGGPGWLAPWKHRAVEAGARTDTHTQTHSVQPIPQPPVTAQQKPFWALWQQPILRSPSYKFWLLIMEMIFC